MHQHPFFTSKTMLAAMAMLTILFAVAGCSGGEPPQAQGPRAAQVEIEEVTPTLFQKTLELPGRISARRVAQVRARVPGIILSRDFQEGSEVVEGQPLFRIDPSQVDASLSQARADLAKAEASMVDLEATAKRYETLMQTKSISQQEYDTAMNNYKAALATRNAAAATVRTAQLSQGYSEVTAPISGTIGRALVTEGALVGEGEATHLATIQQLDPIYADINQPVSEYLKLKAAMRPGQDDNDGATVTVTLDDVGYTATGKLLFSDVTVDQTTSQVSLRCEFPNQDRMLLPGMFVRIKVKLGEGQLAIFVPQRAVQINADGTAQVFVVDEASNAQVRLVKLGQMQGSGWQILDGLAKGERFVSNGVDKVKPGAPVAAKQAAEAPTPGKTAETKE